MMNLKFINWRKLTDFKSNRSGQIKIQKNLIWISLVNFFKEFRIWKLLVTQLTSWKTIRTIVNSWNMKILLSFSKRYVTSTAWLKASSLVKLSSYTIWQSLNKCLYKVSPHKKNTRMTKDKRWTEIFIGWKKCNKIAHTWIVLGSISKRKLQQKKGRCQRN